MDADSAARRWAVTWERAWPARDADSIVALYAADAAYRSVAFREPDRGLAEVRGYLARNFDAESGIECRFGEPLTAGDRAAVQWWASWEEDGQALTLAGVTILRFDRKAWSSTIVTTGTSPTSGSHPTRVGECRPAAAIRSR